MRAGELKALGPESLAKALKKQRPKLHSKVHRRPVSTTRTDSHKGHEIEIKTTYDIKVNGQRIGGHVEVMNNGHVHYHPLPNYSWTSAIGFVRQLIDSFPEEFEGSKGKYKKKTHKGSTQKRTIR